MSDLLRVGDRIFVAGHRGLAGSAIVRRLQGGGYGNLILRTHSELDLGDQAAVESFFRSEKPEAVFLAAAKVGGILANATMPADFIYRNLMIECNVIHAAFQSGVRRLLFLGSSCIYPKMAPQPLREEYLLGGPLEATNEAYAVAKIAGIKLCSAYNRQHGTEFLAVMPTNLYGPGDNYDLRTSHVLPALIRRFQEAKERGDHYVEVWGSGTPRREFLYADDMADACVFVMERMDSAAAGEFINVGTGEDIAIADLARMVADAVGFDGKIVFDSSKPDGTPRKLLDVSRLQAAGWRHTTDLRTGVRLALADFLARRDAIVNAEQVVVPG
ncbi:MAG TPA: GDP-L-fucose synthase [Rhodocyclaceae bacterium]|nr:GDP-L-fucose synthase [Rhodocyclaceae bacterium]